MTNSSSRISMSVAFGHCTSHCIPSKGMVCFVQYVLFTCLKGVSHRGLEDGGSLRFSRVLNLGHSYNCVTKPINKRLTPLHTCNLTQVRVCVCVCVCVCVHIHTCTDSNTLSVYSFLRCSF